MNGSFGKPSAWQRIKPVFTGFDGPLLFAVLVLGALGLVTMYSAGSTTAHASSTTAAT